MNPIAEFIASNADQGASLVIMIVGIIVIGIIASYPYYRFADKQRTRFFEAYKQNNKALAEKYQKRIMTASVAYMLSILVVGFVFITTTMLPVLESYSDCSRTVVGKITVPGYGSESHEFTLCREREYYGAEWSDWFVADRIYNNMQER